MNIICVNVTSLFKNKDVVYNGRKVAFVNPKTCQYLNTLGKTNEILLYTLYNHYFTSTYVDYLHENGLVNLHHFIYPSNVSEATNLSLYNSIIQNSKARNAIIIDKNYFIFNATYSHSLMQKNTIPCDVSKILNIQCCIISGLRNIHDYSDTLRLMLS